MSGSEGGREEAVRSLTRELPGAAKQVETRRAVTEAASYFLLRGGDELLPY